MPIPAFEVLKPHFFELFRIVCGDVTSISQIFAAITDSGEAMDNAIRPAAINRVFFMESSPVRSPLGSADHIR